MASDFCRHCGAGIPPRLGEGTCMKCHSFDPTCLCPKCRAYRYDLEGKCHVLWLLSGKEVEKWNGTGCTCPTVQGNLVCERMKYDCD